MSKLHNSIGTYTSRLQSINDPTVFIQIRNRFPATTVFTAETYGHLSILLLLRALIIHYHIQFTNNPCLINSYIDNLGLIKRISHGRETSISHTQHMDASLLREIESTTRELPFTIQRHHVQSHHYDDVEDLEEIPLPKRVNKMCDVSAELAYTDQSCTLSDPPLELLPQTKAAILWNDTLHTHKLQSTFKFAFQDSRLKEYIHTKAKWSNSIIKTISWNFIKFALLRTTSSIQKRAYIKFSHRLIATNTIKNQRNKSHDHRCTQCHGSHEDWEHIFQCHKLDKTFLKTNLSNLRETFNSMSLSKPITFLLFHGLNLWLTGLPVVFPNSHLEDIQNDKDLQLLFTAFSDQTDIGWDHLICGQIATSWFTAHDHYCTHQHLGSSKFSSSIGPKLVLSFWKFGLAFWYHRNGCIFGSDEESISTFQRQQLHDKITSAFEDPELITDQTDYRTLFSIDKAKLLADTNTAQINWILYYESCLHSPEAPTELSERLTSSQQLHELFRPFSHLYKTNKSASSYRHCL